MTALAGRAAAALAALMLGTCMPAAQPNGTAVAASVAAAPVPPAPPPSEPTRGADFNLEGSARQGALLFGFAPAGAERVTLDGAPVPLDADGRFVIGFDRDRVGEAVLASRTADGVAIVRTLTVEPAAWQIERVDVAARPSGSPAAFLARRRGELVRINAARAVDHDSPGWRQHFIWPAKGRISGRFGSQRVYRGEPGSFHTGVDVAAGAGATVVAPADGVIGLAGPPAFSLEGNLVIIDHGKGLNSAFLHLATVAVEEGQAVRQGDPIGTVGATGRATGPHLHWGMKWRKARVDPERLVAAE